MNYKVLYRKYRPIDFDSVVGQEYTTKLLKNSIIDNKISHAYIFTGPRGTGKTSTAKIFARAINCSNLKNGNPCNECEMCTNFKENPDIVEIDAASNNGVDDIRELIDNARLAPSMSKYKVYIIDEFHMLSPSAFNALLLTLEEPPANVVFILATTDIQCVPITVLSRCQRFDFKPITFDKIVDRLKYVCKQEKIKIEDDAISEIAYMSNGGLRDALSILDQVSVKNEKITVDDIVLNFGSISTDKIKKLVSFLDDGDVDSIVTSLSEFKSNGVDYLILVSKLINYLKQILIDIRNNDCNYSFDFNNIYNLIFELNSSISSFKNSIDPYVFIEIVLLKYIDKNVDDKKAINTPKKEKKVINNQNDKLMDKHDDINASSNSNDVSRVDNKIVVNDINNLNFSIDIRVNNCFANVKKDYLNTIKEKWQDFVIYESNSNKKLLSFILDTNIVCASDEYCIMTNKMDSSVELINNNIESLEKDFNIFFGMKYKMVCLDNDMWTEYINKYKFNIKNNIKYSIIKEVEVEKKSETNDVFNNNGEDVDVLEKLATEIFDNNVEVQ